MSLSVVVVILILGQISYVTMKTEVGSTDGGMTSIDQSHSGEMCIPQEDVSDCSSLLWRNNACQCGADVRKIILCQNNTKHIGILQCYCINNDSNTYYIGGCFYGCFILNKNHHAYTKLYQRYSTNHDISNMCDKWNRSGPLCASCNHGYTVAAYSHSLKCEKCHFYWNNVVRYIVIAYGPLTFFFIIIVVFTLSIHSAPLHGYIFVAQMIATSFSLRILTTMNEVNNPHKSQVYSVSFAATVYGVWNLDFFRFIIPHFCLHPSLSTLNTMLLDYVIALFPYIIMIITYTLVIQHSKGCRLLVLIWRPFHKLFGRFRENLDIRTSLVDAFGTFFSLSYVKFLSTTVDLMTATRTWGVNGEQLTARVYYDGNLKFMEGTHLYYAILALSCLLIFNILPLILLLLYPRRFFQKRLSLSVRHFLHPLMDTLLGIYRDGTDGGADCRYFVVVYPIARMAVFTMQLITQNSFLFLLITIVMTITSILVAMIKPYKSSVYNTVDTALLVILALVYASLTAFFFASYLYSPVLVFSRVLLIIFISLPFLYSCGLTTYWCWTACKLKLKFFRMGQCILEAYKRIYSSATEIFKTRSEMESFSSLSERTLLIPHTNSTSNN